MMQIMRHYLSPTDAIKPSLLFSNILRCISIGSLLQTILLIVNHIAYLCQRNTLLNPLNYNDWGSLFTAMSIDS